jgi:hypothetical protein
MFRRSQRLGLSLLLAARAALAQSVAEPLVAEGTSPAPIAAGAANSRPAWPGDEGPFLLGGDQKFFGRLVSLDPQLEMVVIVMKDARELRPRQSEVVRLVAETGSPLPDPPPIRIALKGGRIIDGTPLDRTMTTITVLSEGQALIIRRPEIAGFTMRSAARGRIEATGLEPARGRVLAIPTGLLNLQGEMTLSVLEGLQPSVAFGIADWLQLSVGSIIDASYASRAGLNGTATLTASRSAGNLLHLAGGLQWAWDRTGRVVSLFAAASIGDDRDHVSFYAGPPPVGVYVMGPVGGLVYAAGGQYTWRPGFALVAELWVADPRSVQRVLNGVGLRRYGTRFSIDAGLVAGWSPGDSDTRIEVRPWVGLTCNAFPGDWF